MSGKLGPWLIAVVVLFATAPAASAVTSGDSDFNPWSLQAELMVDGGPGRVGSIVTIPCAQIHEEIEDFNDEAYDAWDTPDWPYDTSWFWSIEPFDYMIDDLMAWAEENDRTVYGFDTIDYCTTFHKDSWVPANDSILAVVAGDYEPYVHATTDGPTACQYGEILLVGGTRYFLNGQWQYGRGRDWVESYGGPGGITVSGEVIFSCASILGSDPDIARVADAVPSTQVNYNPLVVGLTGLDTWYWYDFTAAESHQITVGAVVSARGTTWPITATAWVDQVWWDPDCEEQCNWRGMLSEHTVGYEEGLVLDLPDTELTPAAVYDGGAGTEDDFAAAHQYETKGVYDVATATIWRGFYTFLGVNYLYDPVMVSSSVPYQVCELQGVLTQPGEDTSALNTCLP